MLLRKLVLMAVAAILLASSGAGALEDREFFIRDGDTVLFWGNSITDYGVYPRLIENYVLTHFPDWRVEFFNLGWGGDQARNVQRLRRDIQLCRPTRVTVMLGMNDGGYRPLSEEHLRIYLDSMRAEVEIMKERSDPEIMLIAPTLYELRCVPFLERGEVDDFGRLRTLMYPETLRRFSYELGLLAGSLGCEFYDLNYDSNRISREMGGYDGNFVYTAESVHPDVNGQLHMGLAILEAMRAPMLVAETVLDAAGGGRKVKLTDCAVNGLEGGPTGVSFRRIAQRLPMPLYPSTKELMKTVLDYPFSWERDIVAVQGLEPGWYEIVIDGRRVDVVSHGSLAEGVNLSRYPDTPQMIQACRLFEQTEIRNRAFYDKWRRVLLEGVGSPRDFTPFRQGVSTDSLDRVERRAFEAQHRLNKPAEHAYSIRRVEHPAIDPAETVLSATEFLDDRVRVLWEVDSRTIPEFEPPLVLRGNFSYAPQYEWGIVEQKSYYGNIPMAMYDDGTHGDREAGDGVYSLEAFFRKDSPPLRFALYDGRFLDGYWNALHWEHFRNDWCHEVTRAWGEGLGAGRVDDDGEVMGVPLDRDREFVWDSETFERALEAGRIYGAQ